EGSLRLPSMVTRRAHKLGNHRFNVDDHASELGKADTWRFSADFCHPLSTVRPFWCTSGALVAVIKKSMAWARGHEARLTRFLAIVWVVAGSVFALVCIAVLALG
ncbi:hypothetical protein ACFVW5_40575, partial [Streptomyces sp. NPDC058232]|uniref:hypothetical protein n=1 Tax=Streptomyces sp. NPDC058232 TaxID=3346393 RepID=UPI0036EF44DA